MRLPVVLLAASLALAGCGDPDPASDTADGGSRSEPVVTTTTSPRTGPSMTAATEGVRVVEVVDGDTIRVTVVGTEDRVRLIGINAPERGECLAEEATRRLRALVDGREVALVPDRTDRDRFGRLLRHVEVDGTDVGATLVADGLSLARPYPPDVARSDRYEAAQRDAQAAGVGMWAPDACGATTTDTEVVIAELRLDADGDDNENLNDEWVRVTNLGGSAVDLTGWILKDTSATHRYPFPDGFVLGAGASVTVRTGCGTDTATDLHWCNEGSAVWNNSGDTAFLLDPSGNIVDSRDG